MIIKGWGCFLCFIACDALLSFLVLACPLWGEHVQVCAAGLEPTCLHGLGLSLVSKETDRRVETGRNVKNNYIAGIWEDRSEKLE